MCLTVIEQVEMFSREYNIHYRACVGSLLYILSTREFLCFALYKLSRFSSNPGKAHFEILVHLLKYIRDNKNLGLKNYAKIEDVPLSDILRHSITNTENQFIVFYDSIWRDCPDTGRSTGTHIFSCQGGPIYHFTHVTGPVAKSSSESEYNSEYNAGMALAHLRIINNELMNKDPYREPLIISDSNSDVFMDNSGKYIKRTRHISRRMHFVRDCKDCNLHKTL